MNGGRVGENLNDVSIKGSKGYVLESAEESGVGGGRVGENGAS